MSDHPIVVFTDGAAKGNPGPGGWGVVVVTPGGHVTELGGGRSPTTNNQMELTGAIQALVSLQGTPGAVAIYTDSTYVIKGIREWIWAWRRRGWKTAEGADVLNRELWEQLAAAVGTRGTAESRGTTCAGTPASRATNGWTKSPRRSHSTAGSSSMLARSPAILCRSSTCLMTRASRKRTAGSPARGLLLPQRR